MEKNGEVFLLGTATAAHQVEGNNVNSDFWAQEHMVNSNFTEPSLDACDHYNKYKEDIVMMKDAGFNAYRFTIEWARIEPEKGRFDEDEIKHYKNVVEFCKNIGIEPIPTMHHFSSPKWLISEGGWKSEIVVERFPIYCKHVMKELGPLLTYVCTINELNMGLQIAAISKRYLKQMGINIQVGIDLPLSEKQIAANEESKRVFNLKEGDTASTFLAMNPPIVDAMAIGAHVEGRKAMKEVAPHLQIGMTLSLHDLQAYDDSEEARRNIEKEWEEEFTHYLPFIEKDEFLGVQNYTRELISKNGIERIPEGAELTQMNYEFYPEALENVIRKVCESYKGNIIVTENGIATNDDARRIEFIRRAMQGVKNCIADDLPVKGYMHWSLLDNFEWQKGYVMKFGLVSVERSNQVRTTKPSFEYLGSYGKNTVL